MHGYFGRYLWVDLTHRRIELRDTDPALAERYLGGAGYGGAHPLR